MTGESRVERIEASPVEWGSGKQADGSIQMPFVVCAPEAERLIRAIYDHHLIVFGFDWSSWQDDARRFLDPEVVHAASLDDVRRLLTLHVRQDRFVEDEDFHSKLRREQAGGCEPSARLAKCC